MAANGRELARLVGQIELHWPVAVHDITLIGHAIGALVAHSACEQSSHAQWTGKVRHVVTLGAPHRGIALERLARRATSALGQLPETRGASRALELRSAGIKDAGRGGKGAFFPHVRYLFIAATVSRKPAGRFGRALGDLVVSRDSALAHPGDGYPVRFPVENYRQIGGINHFELAGHSVVLEQIVKWLSGAPQLPAASSSSDSTQRP